MVGFSIVIGRLVGDVDLRSLGLAIGSKRTRSGCQKYEKERMVDLTLISGMISFDFLVFWPNSSIM